MARQSDPAPPAWRNRIVGHGVKPAKDFLANPDNWRIHPQAQADAVQGSIDELGWIDEVMENVQTGHVIDGHERIILALRKGEETPVPYTSVDLSPEEEKIALAVFDPITSMAVADKEKLDALLRDVTPESAALQQMLSDLAAREGLYTGNGSPTLEDALEPQIDRAAELQEQWGTKSGDLWEIPSLTVQGKSHRLLCGDSCQEKSLEYLLDRVHVDVLCADPPYGMNLDASYKNSTDNLRKGAKKSRGYSPVIGDDKDFDPSPFFEFFRQVPEQFWWGADYYRTYLPSGGSWIVWDKRVGLEDLDYTSTEFELCWSKTAHQRKIIRVRWFGICGTETQDVRERVHPTQKPLEVYAALIGNHSTTGSIIVDPFIGSGTAIVTSERLGRLCYGCDIEPKYIAVTLQRLTDMGLSPRLMES